MRFDQAIVKRFPDISRSRAAQRIKNGDFTVNGKIVKKPSYQISEDAVIQETSNSIPFVSRGGLKLESALHAFAINPTDLTCLDVGASTGGFTQCLLNHGASRVYAVDVGTSQLEVRLRNNPKVHVMENRDIRGIDPEELDPKPTLVVADVSFISLRKIWVPMAKLACADADFVVLFKPQFETEKKALSKSGVVHDPKAAFESLLTLLDQLAQDHFTLQAMLASPILGKQGNTEFLLHICRANQSLLQHDQIRAIVFTAYQKGEKR